MHGTSAHARAVARSISLVLLGTGVLLATGCSGIDIPKPKTVESQDQAGTVLVATTMVAPWEDVAPNLAPQFTMNGTVAATQVLQTTEQSSQQVLNTTALAVGLGLPQSSSTSSTSSQSQQNNGSNTSNGVTTTTGSASNQSNASQSTSNTPGQNVPAPTTSLPTSLPAGPVTASLGIDPVLRYKSAAYLNQEVQLLNQEVTEAARASCYVPYVVKLKLAFMPYVNPLAYSAHTRISFFEGADDRKNLPALVYPKTDQSLEGYERGCGTRKVLPKVVPFLAADDLQLAANSSTSEVARQIALAASYMAGGVFGNLNASNLYEAMTAIQNEEFHSSLTVARAVNNSLYVLISPNNENTGSPALIGQTYDVAVLLLLPKSYFPPKGGAQISIVSYTEFRDAQTGNVLKPRSDQTTVNTINHVVTPFLLQSAAANFESMNLEAQQETLQPYLTEIQTDDLSGFEDLLQENCPIKVANGSKGVPDQFCIRKGDGPAFWSALTTIVDDSSYKTADFEAPLPQDISVPSQQVVVSDDKSGTVTVVLRGVAGASASTLRAELRITPQSTPQNPTIQKPKAVAAAPKPASPPPGKPPATQASAKPAAPAGPAGAKGVLAVAAKPPPAKPPKAAPKAGTTQFFAAQTLAIDSAAHTLTLTFPSPAKAGVSNVWTGAGTDNAIVVAQMPCSDTQLCPDFSSGDLPMSYSIDNSQSSATGSGFQIADAGSTILFDSTGSATLPINVVITKVGVSVELSIAGADVVGVTGPSGNIDPTDKGYQVTASGLYKISFENLPAAAKVTVTAAADASSGSTGSSKGVSHSYVAMPQPSAVSSKGS